MQGAATAAARQYSWPMRTTWSTFILAFAVLTTPIASAAAPLLRATLEVVSMLGGSPVPPWLPSRFYTVDFDFSLVGTYTDAGGNVTTLPDLPQADRFFAHVNENFYTFGTGNYSKVKDYSFGQWTLFPSGQDNSWSGGGFHYKTRVSFVSGTDIDATYVDGFWQDLLPVADPDALFHGGSMWLIYDTDRWPNGAEYQGTFLANLVSVTTVDEPPTPALVLLGVGVAAALRRRKYRSHV